MKRAFTATFALRGRSEKHNLFKSAIERQTFISREAINSKMVPPGSSEFWSRHKVPQLQAAIGARHLVGVVLVKARVHTCGDETVRSTSGKRTPNEAARHHNASNVKWPGSECHDLDLR